jgi:hypothetical protein
MAENSLAPRDPRTPEIAGYGELLENLKGVNNLGTYGRWAFAELTEVLQIQADFEARVEAEINRMIEDAAGGLVHDKAHQVMYH